MACCDSKPHEFHITLFVEQVLGTEIKIRPRLSLFLQFKNKMSCLLLYDCLNEILENLEEDKFTLHSCLLVNRL